MKYSQFVCVIIGITAGEGFYKKEGFFKRPINGYSKTTEK